MYGADPLLDGFKDKAALEFGEDSNARLNHLRLIGSSPDTRLVVTTADIIPDLMLLQPDDLPERYRWKRHQFLTIDEIRNDLKIQPKMLMKPQVRLILFDVHSIRKHIEDRHLGRWIDLLIEREGSILTLMY